MTAPQLEEWIHKTVIQHLRARAVPGAVYFHVPNSGRSRHIRHFDVPLYERNGWLCQFLYIRGDDLHCYIATFKCCDMRMDNK